MKKILFFIFISILSFVVLFFPAVMPQKSDKLVFSSWGSQSEVEILKDLISDFEKNSGIKVEFLHIPQNYFQKLHLLFASKTEPDVIFINNHYSKMYINAELLENLTPYFTNDFNNYFDVALGCFSQNGNIYAIPRDLSNLVLYVNKDIFKKNNVEYKRKIESLGELVEIAQKLTSENNFGINFEDGQIYWLYYLAANGGSILSDDLSSFTLNSKESISALNLYSDFVNKYHIAPSKSDIGSMTTAQMFMNGKIAMYLSGRWLTPVFRENITFDWDIIEFPSSLENKVYVDSSGWAVSKNSKKKNEAVKFIKYLSATNSITKFTQTGLILPARIDIAKEFFVRSSISKPENEDIFIEMLRYSKPTPVNVNYQKISDILKEKTEIIFYGFAEAGNVINEKVAKKIERLL